MDGTLHMLGFSDCIRATMEAESSRIISTSLREELKAASIKIELLEQSAIVKYGDLKNNKKHIYKL